MLLARRGFGWGLRRERQKESEGPAAIAGNIVFAGAARIDGWTTYKSSRGRTWLQSGNCRECDRGSGFRFTAAAVESELGPVTV